MGPQNHNFVRNFNDDDCSRRGFVDGGADRKRCSCDTDSSQCYDYFLKNFLWRRILPYCLIMGRDMKLKIMIVTHILRELRTLVF